MENIRGSCNPNLIQFGQIIGHGTFGKVYASRDCSTNTDVAVKVANLEVMTDREWELLMVEIYNLQQLEHEGIIKVIDSLQSYSCVYLIMPLMAYNSCSQIIERYFPTGMPESSVGIILNNVLNAIEYLHTRNFIHSGIKGSHILINSSGAAIISGFRFTTKVEAKSKKFLVSDLKEMTKNLNWLSPELLSQDNSGYSYNSDVYSVGITACELGNGVVPYAEMSASAMLVKKLEESPPRLWDKNFVPSQESEGITPLASSSHSRVSEEDMACAVSNAYSNAQSMDSVYASKVFSRDFHNFVSLCLVKEADLRPSSSQILRHRFMKTYQNNNSIQLLKGLGLKEPTEFENIVGDRLPVEVSAQGDSNYRFEWNF